jgi:hypothetical protein
MTTMVEYYIAHASTITSLQAEVNTLYEAGWRPHGSLVECNTQFSPYFAQAMVRTQLGVNDR